MASNDGTGLGVKDKIVFILNSINNTPLRTCEIKNAMLRLYRKEEVISTSEILRVLKSYEKEGLFKSQKSVYTNQLKWRIE